MTNDNVITGDFTVTDEETVEAPQFHTVLEVWREVLKPAAEDAKERITLGWAAKVVGSYQEVSYADMGFFRDSYYAKIAELVEILDAEIAKDRDCLTYETAEDDAVENAQHYKNLITDWQLQILGWELSWDWADPHAGAEAAAISEVHKMFFGSPERPGLVQYLDNIKLEFTEADQQAMYEALEARKQEGPRD